MPKQLSKIQREILELFHPDPASAVWDCRGTLVIYHKAIELIAANANIKFDLPQVITCDPDKKTVAILVTGSMGDRSEWSIGEAAPYNNKNPYPFAMAEKRAKDRVVLKLLNLHGEIYSEDEADAFKDVTVTVETKAPQQDNSALRDIIVDEISKIDCPRELQAWGMDNAETISTLDEENRDAVRLAFSQRKSELKAVA